MYITFVTVWVVPLPTKYANNSLENVKPKWNPLLKNPRSATVNEQISTKFMQNIKYKAKEMLNAIPGFSQ